MQSAERIERVIISGGGGQKIPLGEIKGKIGQVSGISGAKYDLHHKNIQVLYIYI